MLKKVKKTKRLAVGILFSALLFLPISRALAQDQDPPGRIARINYTEGSVSFQPAGEGDWLTVVPNRPITTGDNLWTDQNSRDELHVGSTVLRMGPETSVSFLDLNDHATQLRLSVGSMILRVRHLDDDDNYEVDTPNVAFMVRRPGEYRLDVNQDGTMTKVSVWHGQGETTGGGSSYTVVAGQRAVFSGADEIAHDIQPIGGRDGFESWAFDRDAREDHLEAQNYVSEEMTGYEDLDRNGSWSYVGGYGNVWMPRGVPEGWAPYRYGHWAWVAPWGWTWVEDEPWGFAPFHYGRWAFGSVGWFWVPGPVVVRPVYAPALVAFVGGVGFAIGGGPAVAWFPLGPHEVFVPGYRVSSRYVTEVNVTNTVVNVTRVTNVYNNYVSHTENNIRVTYVNQGVGNAVTAVNRDTFVNARPVYRGMVHVDERQIAEAPVSHEMVPQPQRPSVLGSGSPARVHPPAAIETRQVVAARAPAPPRPSFGSPARAEVARPLAETPQTAENRPMPRPPADNRPIDEYQKERAASEPAPATQGERSNAPEEQAARNVPRPPQPQNQENNVRQQEQQREQEQRQEQERQQEQARQQQWSHPLAKPAPPVREPSPQQQHQEEQKFQNWQKQERSAPPPAKSTAAPKDSRDEKH